MVEEKLKSAESPRFKLIATDGVFSMDGIIANLAGVVELAKKYDALVMVDDSHATGFVGQHGKGTPEYCGVESEIDILTGTFGKALGGASGGYTTASQAIVSWLRQRSRPYLFSNSVAPVVVSTTIAALTLIEQGDDLRKQLVSNSERFRSSMSKLGFELVPGEHPIIPVMLGDARLAQDMASRMLELGVYVIGFSFPVVPKGMARIRTQMSAAHTSSNIDQAVNAFEQAGREFGVI